MSDRRVTRQRIDRLEERVDGLKRDYLRERGWAESCQHPGSNWLWEKKVGEKVYYLPTETAVSIEYAVSGIDEPAEPEPHDLDDPEPTGERT